MTRPAGVTALSLFFAFGLVMAGLACLALLFPGSMLKELWRLNPSARTSFETMGAWGPALMAPVALSCGLAAYGLWSGKRWSRGLAIGILAVNLVGDVANALVRGDHRTLIGVPIALLMVGYLLSSRAGLWLAGRTENG